MANRSNAQDTGEFRLSLGAILDELERDYAVRDFIFQGAPGDWCLTIRRDTGYTDPQGIYVTREQAAQTMLDAVKGTTVSKSDDDYLAIDWPEILPGASDKGNKPQ